MKETGKQLIILFITLLLFSPDTFAGDDDVTVSASVNNNIVYTGEHFTLNLEAISSAVRSVSRPQFPAVDGIRLVSPNPATTTGFSMVNGVTTATYGYRYTLRADQEGVYTIPGIDFRIDGKTYTTEPIEIRVVKREQVQQQRQELPEIYLQLELSNESPFVGQQVTANIVLYFRNDIDILSYQPVSAWRTEGFWLENLNEGMANPRAETVMIRGVRYRKAVLMSYALFPTRAGKLNLGSYAIRANVRFSGRYDDATQRFFSGFGRTQRNVDLESEARELTIRRLPAPQPESFTGAVGRFSINREITDSELNLGEPLEIITTIEGTGNISLINHPRFSVPEEFERFQPQENTNIQKTQSAIRGSKTFTDILIGRQVGEFEIPDAEFSWFDPASGRYVTRTLPAQIVSVIRDPGLVGARVDDNRLTLSPVIGVTTWRKNDGRNPYSAWWFWLIAILPLIIFAAARHRRIYLERMQHDSAFYRYQRADEHAQEILHSANQKASENRWRDAYGLLHRAVAIYIADRLNLPPAGHSDAHIVSLVREKGADQSLINQISRLLNQFSSIQYAPESMAESFEHDAEQARDVIRKCKKIL